MLKQSVQLEIAQTPKIQLRTTGPSVCTVKTCVLLQIFKVCLHFLRLFGGSKRRLETRYPKKISPETRKLQRSLCKSYTFRVLQSEFHSQGALAFSPKYFSWRTTCHSTETQAACMVRYWNGCHFVGSRTSSCHGSPEDFTVTCCHGFNVGCKETGCRRGMVRTYANITQH